MLHMSALAALIPANMPPATQARTKILFFGNPFPSITAKKQSF
jgi:hypothetical protein